MSHVPSLVDKGIEKLRNNGDKIGAAQFLAKAIRTDPNPELVSLWFSGVVETVAEQVDCLKRILAINSKNDAAKNGLGILDPDTAPAWPLASESQTSICEFPGCDEPVSNAGFSLYHGHSPELTAASPSVSARGLLASTLKATDIGDQLGLSSQSINSVLARLGWIGKDRGGWVPPRSDALSAVCRSDLSKPASHTSPGGRRFRVIRFCAIQRKTSKEKAW